MRKSTLNYSTPAINRLNKLRVKNKLFLRFEILKMIYSVLFVFQKKTIFLMPMTDVSVATDFTSRITR